MRLRRFTFRSKILTSVFTCVIFVVICMVVSAPESLKLTVTQTVVEPFVAETLVPVRNATKELAECLEQQEPSLKEKCTIELVSAFGRDFRIFDELLLNWKQLQRRWVAELTAGSASAKALRVLVISSVSNTDESVGWFKEWSNYLARSGFSDTFHFALNHFDNLSDKWEEILKQNSDIVILRRYGLHCKVEFWTHILTSMSREYDYLWLTDDDIDLSFFSWPLTRIILNTLQPLLVHPSVAPVFEGSRKSDHSSLRMRYMEIGGYPVMAKNNDFTEVMTSLIDARFWPTIYHRLEDWDLSSVWAIDRYWSAIALRWGNGTCDLQAPVIVLPGSPVVHMNRNSIKAIKINGKRGCVKGWSGDNKAKSLFHGDYEANVLAELYTELNCEANPMSVYDPHEVWSVNKLLQHNL